MIIRNEKDRLKAMRMLEDAELPCQIVIADGKASEGVMHQLQALQAYIEHVYPDTTEPLTAMQQANMIAAKDLEVMRKVANERSEREYPDTPEPELGDHTSGMEDCCE